MLEPSEFFRRRPTIRVRDGENVYTIRDAFPKTAWEREQLKKLTAIPVYFPIVAAVGVGSIFVDGRPDSPRAITIIEESAIILNRLTMQKRSPWLWAYGPVLCHEIAHLDGHMEHDKEMDAASFQIFRRLVEVLEP